MMLSAAEGQTECMQLLLAAHDPAAQVSGMDTSPPSTLRGGADGNPDTAAHSLHAAQVGAVGSLGENALVLATDAGHTRGVRLLLEQPRVREQLEALEENSYGVVVTAVVGGKTGCLKLLLETCGGLLASRLLQPVNA